jgi:hypothetical protein
VEKTATFVFGGVEQTYTARVTTDKSGTRVVSMHVRGPDGPISIDKQLYTDIEGPALNYLSLMHINTTVSVNIFYCPKRGQTDCDLDTMHIVQFPIAAGRIKERHFMTQQGWLDPTPERVPYGK